jgi:hypothetical protein
MMSKVKRISCCRLLEVGFKLEHTNGLDFEAQLHSATHMSASSSSDDSLPYSIMLMGQSFLGLSQLLTTLLDSLARFSQSKAFCRTWLMLEKTQLYSFCLRCDDKSKYAKSAKSLSEIFKLKHKFLVSLNLLM